MTEPTHEAAREGVSPPGMPRWVKSSLIVVAALVVILAIFKLTGAGGQHSPNRHGAAGPLVTAEAGAVQLGRVSHIRL